MGRGWRVVDDAVQIPFTHFALYLSAIGCRIARKVGGDVPPLRLRSKLSERLRARGKRAEGGVRGLQRL